MRKEREAQHTNENDISVLEFRSADKIILWFEQPLPSDALQRIQKGFGDPEHCEVLTGIRTPDAVYIQRHH